MNMKYILRATIFIICLIGMMSGIASAGVQTGLPYEGTRNLPPDDSYAFFDFEEGTGMFQTLSPSYNEHVKFVNIFVNNEENIWCYQDSEYPLLHVYPNNALFQDEAHTIPVTYTYLIQGRYAAATKVEVFIGGYYIGTDAIIELPNGANHISFLVSTGNDVTMRAYSKTGKLIGAIRATRTIDRISLPNGPSTWSIISFNTSAPDIHKVHLTGTHNDWMIDDLVIGGLPQEDLINYEYAAERMEELIGVKFLEYGTGYDYSMEEYYTTQEIIDGNIPYWDPYKKEIKIGDGIYDEDAILWAFNVNDDLVNWKNIDKMASNDFKIKVKYGEQQPGDVFFLDYDGNGKYNEVGIFIEPTIDDDGMVVDIIRIIPNIGVHYSSVEFIHALYGIDDGIEPSSSMDCKRLPNNPKGGHSPYKKIPTKFFI